jgi:hypothetical protein
MWSVKRDFWGFSFSGLWRGLRVKMAQNKCFSAVIGLAHGVVVATHNRANLGELFAALVMESHDLAIAGREFLY